MGTAPGNEGRVGMGRQAALRLKGVCGFLICKRDVKRLPVKLNSSRRPCRRGGYRDWGGDKGLSHSRREKTRDKYP